MNTLSVTPTEENGLSFELFVDGKALGEILNDGNEGIPYWLVTDGLPTCPPSGPTANSTIRIVTVCSCGEYGCGHSRCHVTGDEGTVVFSNFEGDVGEKGKDIRFVFNADEYRRVCQTIVRLASDRQSKEG